MREALAPLGKYLLPVAVVGAVAYGALHYTPTLSFDLFSRACEKPLTYALGTYDERFGISKEVLATAAQKAASVWNDAVGKTLIEVSTDSDILINLAYDERQEAVRLGKTLSAEQQTYDAMKAGIDTKREAYQKAARAYERQEATYEADVAAYEKDVAYWNAQGGAPPSEYAALEEEKQRLRRAHDRLQTSVAQVNALADQIQKDVTALNVFADQMNEKVDVYNSAVGEDFDQGTYVEDEQGKRITIFEFKNTDELTRVLTHEFGHALGLGHVDDPKAVMYSYNLGESLVLTEADKIALQELCKL